MAKCGIKVISEQQQNDGPSNGPLKEPWQTQEGFYWLGWRSSGNSEAGLRWDSLISSFSQTGVTCYLRCLTPHNPAWPHIKYPHCLENLGMSSALQSLALYVTWACDILSKVWVILYLLLKKQMREISSEWYTVVAGMLAMMSGNNTEYILVCSNINREKKYVHVTCCMLLKEQFQMYNNHINKEFPSSEYALYLVYIFLTIYYAHLILWHNYMFRKCDAAFYQYCTWLRKHDQQKPEHDFPHI